MADRIVRAISTDGMVQAAAICSRDLTERARQIHKTLPVARRRTVESICQCQPMARHAGGCFYAGGHFLCGIGVV